MAAAHSPPCSQCFVAANPGGGGDADQKAHCWLEEDDQVAVFVKSRTAALAVEIFFPGVSELGLVEIAEDLDRGGNHVENGEDRDLKFSKSSVLRVSVMGCSIL